MATVKFYLTRPKSDKPTAIFFLMNYGAYTILPDGKKKYLPLKYYTNAGKMGYESWCSDRSYSEESPDERW